MAGFVIAVTPSPPHPPHYWTLLTLRIVRHFRSCLQHNRCGGNHPRLEGGEFGVGHVAEPFGDRIGRKMQIQGLRWSTITAVQERRRGVVARRIGVVVLRKLNQGVDRQGGVLAGLDHQVGDRPAICNRRVGSVPRRYWRVFRSAGRVSTAALHKPTLACFVCHLSSSLRESQYSQILNRANQI